MASSTDTPVNNRQSAIVPMESNSGEVVMDLSIKKSDEENDGPVRVEMIPSNYEVNDLIIDTEGVDETIEVKVGDSDDQTEQNHHPKRSRKRKQPPEKVIQSCIDGGHIIQDAVVKGSVTLIQAPGNEDDIIVSNADVDVETVLEVETSQPAPEVPIAQLKIPTVTAPLTVNETTSNISASTQLPTSLIGSPLFSSNGKSVRPFKLYTQNRDLLAGIGLDKDNISTLAAALTGRPLVAPAVVGSTAIGSVTAMPVLKTPTVPATVPTGIPLTTMSDVGSTAGDSPTIIPVPTSVVTTATPSAMRLMTLATEADKILKEKRQETFGNDGKNNVPLLIAASDAVGNPTALGRIQTDGTIQFTLHPQQIALTTEEPKSKKKKDRQTLPDSMKTPNYWQRRRKNNEAAKRSRDARRSKEDQIAIRAAMLEHENTKLKIEVAALKEEVKQLRGELYERKKVDTSQ